MALPHLNTTLPLGGFAKSWSGIEIKEFYRGELITLSVKQGQNEAFNAAFKDAYDASPPAPNQLQTIEGGFAFSMCCRYHF